MKNYAAIFLTTILILTASAGFTAAQDATDSYFANQVKLSKPQNAKSKANESQNGAQPSNDNLADAETITVNGSGFAALTRSTVGASEETDEPTHADNPGGVSVWFQYTPTATKAVEISTASNDTDFDTLLAVYQGNSLQALTRIGDNDDCYSETGCGGGRSRVRLLVQAGVTYRIAVDGYNNGFNVSSGTFKLIVAERDTPFSYDNISNAYDLGVAHAGSIAGTNHLATTEPNEPIQHVPGMAGDKSVWYHFRTTDRRAMTFEIKADFEAGISVYESPVENPTFAQMTRLRGNSYGYSFQYGKIIVNFAAQTDKHYFIVVGQVIKVSPDLPETGNFQLKFYQAKLRYSTRRNVYVPQASVNLFRPSEGVWYDRYTLHVDSLFYTKFGISGDTPIPADYNGDGMTNYAVTRNENGLKHWYIQRPGSISLYDSFQWGLATDKAITGDFDRDGIADLAVIRNQNGSLVWYVRQSTDGELKTFVFGITGDKPVIADFDNDGATDLAVTRQVNGNIVWHVMKSGYLTAVVSTYSEYEVVNFGGGSDSPLAEDFDGDGRADYAVFRQVSGTWYILRSTTNQVQTTQFGQLLDKPQPADYDADGKADLAVYRPSEGNWYFWLSGSNTQKVLKWGNSGDIPVTSMTSLSQ